MANITPNAAQLEAINLIDGPLLISAGPGTGKTATLVKKYVTKRHPELKWGFVRDIGEKLLH